jgi:HlyD family secretion protein
VEVPNPQLKLMPGLTANLNISIKSKSRVLKIPATAFGFNPPMEYIKTAVQLSASEKQKWQQTLFQKSEQKKQEIVITDTQEGYVWLKRCQDIEAVQLQKGLSDGTFTEVTGNIKAGEEVVTGINQSAPEKKAGNSPFMPKFPSKKK